MKQKPFKSKQKTCKFSGCGKPFMTQRAMQTVCGPMCGALMARANREKAEAKEHRACVRAVREKHKTRGDYMKDAQRDFNAYIRERDAGLPCICCGSHSKGHTRGGDWDAGHYRSRGAAPHMRFDETNVHAQLKNCNRYKSGNIVGYRMGLIERIGLAAVEAIERDQESRPYTVNDLVEIAKTYRAKRRALIKARGAGNAAK